MANNTCGLLSTTSENVSPLLQYAQVKVCEVILEDF